MHSLSCSGVRALRDVFDARRQREVQTETWRGQRQCQLTSSLSLALLAAFPDVVCVYAHLPISRFLQVVFSIVKPILPYFPIHNGEEFHQRHDLYEESQSAETYKQENKIKE